MLKAIHKIFLFHPSSKHTKPLTLPFTAQFTDGKFVKSMKYDFKIYQ